MPKLKAGTVSCKATKWYPRVTAGPLRNQYIHRIVAAAMLGRLLTKDEEVHHRDGDRRNFEFTNLIVMGNKDRGWVSAKQAWFMRDRDAKEKKEWDAFMAEEAGQFQQDVALAKSFDQDWQPRPDGELKERWEKTMKKIDASTALTIALVCRWDFQMGLISKQAFQEHLAEIGKMWVCRLHPQLRWPCAVCGMKKPKLVTAPKEKPEQPIDLDALRKLKLNDAVFSADPAVLEMIHGIPLVAMDTVREIHNSTSVYAKAVDTLLGAITQLLSDVRNSISGRAGAHHRAMANVQRCMDEVEKLTIKHGLPVYEWCPKHPQHYKLNCTVCKLETDPFHDQGNGTNHRISQCGPNCKEE